MSALVSQFNGILQDRHHAQAEQIDFDDAEVFAIFFVPLGHGAARHGGGFQWDDGIKLALADNHASGMLAEVARQTIHRAIKRKERLGARVVQGHAGLLKLRAQFQRVREIAIGKEMGKPSQHIIGKIERFADFARGAAASISDHIRGHGGAATAIAPINFLNGLFAAVAAGQIQIDIRPALAALAEEALKEQIAAHRIHGCDAQAVADGAVGGAAAALDHDFIVAAEIDDVPYDQKIPGKTELLNHSQFVIELRDDLWSELTIAVPGAGKGLLAKKAVHRVAGRHRVGGELIAEVFQ